MRAADDAGLRAVARVRTMREQDSLFGLQHALVEARDQQQRVAALDSRLDRTAAPAACTVSSFLQVRGSMLDLGRAITESQQTLETAETMATAALGRWQHDKQQLEAIELLLERRADEAREEARREEAKENDETATQLWRRVRTASAPAEVSAR